MAAETGPGRKIRKPGPKGPDEFELKVAEELFKLEGASPDLARLEKLYILGAKEVAVDGSKSAAVIMIPYKFLQEFRKIQVKLVRELEKKLQGRHVIVVAHRTIFGKSYERNVKTKGPRPRSRTLTHVHEAILDDLCFPTEILGKRVRYKTDGSKVTKVFLAPRDQVNVEVKLETFATVYQKLTGKNVVFSFQTQS